MVEKTEESRITQTLVPKAKKVKFWPQDQEANLDFVIVNCLSVTDKIEILLEVF